MSNEKIGIGGKTAEDIKGVMGYTDQTEVCKNCGAFMPWESNDNDNRKPTRCEYNVFWFEVSEGGHCRHWFLKNGGKQTDYF